MVSPGEPSTYPLALVQKINTNVLGEVVSVTLKRGDNSEIVDRHIQNIVPMLQFKSIPVTSEESSGEVFIANQKGAESTHRPKRKAAISAENRIKQLL